MDPHGFRVDSLGFPVDPCSFHMEPSWILENPRGSCFILLYFTVPLDSLIFHENPTWIHMESVGEVPLVNVAKSMFGRTKLLRARTLASRSSFCFKTLSLNCRLYCTILGHPLKEAGCP